MSDLLDYEPTWEHLGNQEYRCKVHDIFFGMRATSIEYEPNKFALGVCHECVRTPKPPKMPADMVRPDYWATGTVVSVENGRERITGNDGRDRMLRCLYHPGARFELDEACASCLAEDAAEAARGPTAS